MDAVALLESIIAIITGGIEAMASGLGTGVNALVTSIFIDSTTHGLSSFGAVVCIFAGIALCVGLSKLIFRWVGSLGGSRL